MKPIVRILVLCALLPFSSMGQKMGPFISLSLSNNGQVPDIGDYFYSGLPPQATYSYSISKFKIDLYGEMKLKNNFFLSLKGGFGKRKDKYDIDSGGSHGEVEQKFTELAIGMNYQASIDKFTFTSGLSVPIFFVSDYHRTDVSEVPGNESIYTYNLKGGTAFGLNSVSSIRFALSSRLCLITSFSVGYLRTSVGGRIETKNDYQDPNVADTSDVSEGSQFKKSGITSPDISIGIGYKF